jgi:hypothetical protein
MREFTVDFPVIYELERRLDDLEKIPGYNDLDNVISQKEITSAISKLKNKKAPGLDNFKISKTVKINLN